MHMRTYIVCADIGKDVFSCMVLCHHCIQWYVQLDMMPEAHTSEYQHTQYGWYKNTTEVIHEQIFVVPLPNTWCCVKSTACVISGDDLTSDSADWSCRTVLIYCTGICCIFTAPDIAITTPVLTLRTDTAVNAVNQDWHTYFAPECCQWQAGKS